MLDLNTYIIQIVGCLFSLHVLAGVGLFRQAVGVDAPQYVFYHENGSLVGVNA